MQNKVKAIKALDLVVLALLLFLGLLFLLPQKQISSHRVLLKYETSRDVSAIAPVATKTKEIYFDSEKDPVKVISAILKGDKLEVTLEGPGSVESGKLVFNGLRVMIGQKAELHGDFWSQGVITEIKYAD
jgi:hypothetical protein